MAATGTRRAATATAARNLDATISRSSSAPFDVHRATTTALFCAKPAPLITTIPTFRLATRCWCFLLFAVASAEFFSGVHSRWGGGSEAYSIIKGCERGLGSSGGALGPSRHQLGVYGNL